MRTTAFPPSCCARSVRRRQCENLPALADGRGPVRKPPPRERMESVVVVRGLKAEEQKRKAPQQDESTKGFGTSMSRGGAEHAEKIVRNEHCNWPSAVTAAPRDQVFQLSNFFRASLGLYDLPLHFRQPGVFLAIPQRLRRINRRRSARWHHER
jgi:hypothetical protein